MNANIGIFEANYYLPATKKALSQVFEDEEKPTATFAANVDFKRDIGIEAVHVAGEETAASLAIKAAKSVVEKAGIDPREIDLIIDFTSIPEDYVAPTWSAAGMVQKEIGATRAFATAINTGGCASYQTTLKVACSLMSANDRYNTALLVAGDKTPEFNHNYFPITVGSYGGSAVILKKNMTKRHILGVEVATVGRLHDMWFIPGIHNRKPEDIGGKYPRWLHVCGDVQRFNKELIPINLFMFRKVIQGVLKQVGQKIQETKHDFEVAILGNGLSGSMLGTILGKKGASVVIIDEDQHPRFAVGESTIPHTSLIVSILAEKYDLPELEHIVDTQQLAKHVCTTCGIKRHFGYVYHRPGHAYDRKEGLQFGTAARDENHWFRQDIDAYLHNLAVHYGAIPRQKTKVTSLEINRHGVKLQTSSGEELRARYLVDG